MSRYNSEHQIPLNVTALDIKFHTKWQLWVQNSSSEHARQDAEISTCLRAGNLYISEAKSVGIFLGESLLEFTEAN